MSARRFSKATDTLGSTVEHITNTLPARIAAATPSLPPPSPPGGPNSTLSVWAALTTTETTTSHCAPSSASEAQALPPSRTKASATSLRTSNT